MIKKINNTKNKKNVKNKKRSLQMLINQTEILKNKTIPNRTF